VFLASGLYMLFIARKFSSYVGRARDQRAVRSIKFKRNILLVIAVTLLAAAAWNAGLFIRAGGL